MGERRNCTGMSEPDPFQNATEWVCECGAVANPVSGEWRWDGQNWQHWHGYPVGHVIAIKKGKE